LKDEVPKNISKKDYIIKVVYEELVKFLGGDGAKINISRKPFYIMLVGLFGSGKTTTSGKLAKYYQKRGYKVGLISTDTWRPAAYEQLQQLSQKVGVDFYGIKGEKNPVKIFQTYENDLKKYDIVLIDTAGRDALNDELIEELNKIRSIVKADETCL